jgi:excisionase family DNA binding protein
VTTTAEDLRHGTTDRSKLLSSGEVATALGVSRDVVRRLANAGEIPVVRLGRNYRFRRSDVEPMAAIVRGEA